MPTLIRCYACKTDGAGTMFDKTLSACPQCEAPRRGHNAYLNTAKLNNHLYAMADGTTERQGWMSAREAAKEHVANLLA